LYENIFWGIIECREVIILSIGDRIKEKRIEAGLTQTELGQSIHVSKVTVHKYETGFITNIPLEKIEMIAKVLGTTPAYLMGFDIPQGINDLTPYERNTILKLRAASQKRKDIVDRILEDD
jgi:transcriptional regulator with XRE-family HTH domain